MNWSARGFPPVPAVDPIPVTIPENPSTSLNVIIFSIFRFGVSANIDGTSVFVYPNPGLVIETEETDPFAIVAVAVAAVAVVATPTGGLSNLKDIVVWSDEYPEPGLVVVIPIIVLPTPTEQLNVAVTGLVFSTINPPKPSACTSVNLDWLGANNPDSYLNNSEVSMNISVSDIDTSLIILAVGNIKGSNVSLDLYTYSPLTFWLVFCLVQERGWDVFVSPLTPNPEYRLVSNLSELVKL